MHGSVSLVKLEETKVIIDFNSLEHGYYPDVCEGVDNVLEVVAKNQAIV